MNKAVKQGYFSIVSGELIYLFLMYRQSVSSLLQMIGITPVP